MTDRENMYKTSTMCMDILVDKPGFPDFAFVLYDGGWFTHHVILERDVVRIGGVVARGARRENRAPSRVGEFNREYADRVFGYMKERNRSEDGRLNADDVAIIPFGKREQELLSLGEIAETHSFPDGVTLKTIDYRWKEGKRIKVYSPPNVILVEHSQ